MKYQHFWEDYGEDEEGYVNSLMCYYCKVISSGPPEEHRKLNEEECTAP